MWQHQFSGFDNALPLFTGIWGSWVINTIYFLWVYNFLYTIFHNFLRVYHFRGKKVKRHANWKFQVFWKDLAAFGVTGWFSRKIDTFIWNSQGTLFRVLSLGSHAPISCISLKAQSMELGNAWYMLGINTHSISSLWIWFPYPQLCLRWFTVEGLSVIPFLESKLPVYACEVGEE